MTDTDLTLIRKSIAAGLGLTYGRAALLLAALDEARETLTWIRSRCDPERDMWLIQAIEQAVKE